MTEQQYLQHAINLALEHSADGMHGPFGAVVVKDGKIIGEGWNQVVETRDPSAHAEIISIRQASQAIEDFDLEGATLYTSCEPCPMCFAASYWANIAKIVYASSKNDAAKAGFDDAFIYEEINKDQNDRSVDFVQILEDEGREVFEAWDKNPNKKMY